MPEAPPKRTEAEYEQALLEASEFSRQVIDCAHAGIIVYGPDLKYRVWNPYMERLTGMSADDVLGRHPLQLFPFLLPAGVMARLEQALAGETPDPIHFPFHIPASGRSGWAADASAPLRNAGGDIIGVISTISDITGCKKAEEAARGSRDYYLKLLEDLPSPIWRSGVDGGCDYFNLTWLQFTGRTLEQEIGNGWVEGVHPEDRDRCFATYLDAFRRRQPFHMEYRLRHHDGTYHWISDYGAPYEDTDGEFAGYIGNCHDITAQKLMDAVRLEAHAELEQWVEERTRELRKSHDLLSCLSRQVPGGIYQFQMLPEGRYCLPYASDAFLEMFEVAPEETGEDAGAVFKRIHPDDSARVFAAIDNSARTLQPFFCEYRVMLPRKGLRWHIANARPQRLENGGILWNGFISDTTERKAMEAELLESRFQLTEAQRQAKVGSWTWTIETDSVTWSEELYAIFGRDPDQPAMAYAEHSAIYTPESFQQLDRAVAHALATGEPYELELELIRNDGAHRFGLARGEAIRNESGRVARLHGTLQDITERKRAEVALRESEVRFRQIFEQSEDAIIFFKPGTCTIIDVNLTAETLYGYSKAELRGRGLELLIRPEDMVRMSRIISSVSREGMTQLENIINVRKDGTELIASMRGKVMVLQGTEIIYCTFRDVTDRVRMEEEARSIQAKLIQTNKMTSLGLLVSGVAHEINNPNNFIMANAELLNRSWDDALKILREYYRENGEFFIGGIAFSELEAHSPRLFEGISDGARRINEIVNNLKKFARDDQVVTERDVDINRVATSAVSILHYELNTFTDNFQLDLAPDIPLVKGSSQQLGQVIINLLMNACQALPAKRYGIRLATGFDPAANQVTITVRDEGLGMSREDRNRILEPFFTTKLDSGGTGLGLSICHSILREHNALLEFESEPGKGTTFIVKIPAGNPAAEERSP